jgi:cation/acetate symporter
MQENPPVLIRLPASLRAELDDPLTALADPGIISVPAGLLAGVLGTLLTGREPGAAQRFEDLRVHALTGCGAETPEAAS